MQDEPITHGRNSPGRATPGAYCVKSNVRTSAAPGSTRYGSIVTESMVRYGGITVARSTPPVSAKSWNRSTMFTIAPTVRLGWTTIGPATTSGTSTPVWKTVPLA